ncbi:CHASE2 domain-containing protein [Acetobacter fabarum]|uniref:CHASE2 domain-containing protein n=1 Tax=Acetobacter fabarum TaxID=483199 RepID=UPI0033B4B0DD
MKKSSAKRSALKGNIVYFVGIIIFWVLFKFLDPLGIETATKQSSAAFFDAIEAPFYGISSTETHKHVAVVTINDHTLEYFDESFPFNYKTHIIILQKIMAAHPAAIYVDLRMMRERSGEELSSFAPVIQEAERLKIPLFFARGSAVEGQPDLPEPLRPHQAFSVIRNAENLYPLWIKDGQTEVPNAAFAVYESLCKTRYYSVCGQSIHKNFEKPLLVRWGLKPDPEQALVSFVPEENFFSLGSTPIVLALKRGVSSFSKVLRPDKNEAQFYPLVMGAEQLEFRGRNTNEQSPPLANLLKDRAVFYGVDILDQHDDTPIAGLGLMPNVITHAMAFDNLMTYNTHYFHESGEIEGLPLDNAEIFEFLIWFILATIIRIPKYKRAEFLNARGKSIEKLHPKLKTLWPALVAFTLTAIFFVFDLSQREKIITAIPYLFCAYILFFVLIIISIYILRNYNNFLINRQDNNTLEKSEESMTPLSHLGVLLALAAVGFVFNELITRWPNSDWIGLLLMWLALAEWNEWREEI